MVRRPVLRDKPAGAIPAGFFAYREQEKPRCSKRVTGDNGDNGDNGEYWRMNAEGLVTITFKKFYNPPHGGFFHGRRRAVFPPNEFLKLPG